jgi:glutaminyl-peptide cyclotransferase
MFAFFDGEECISRYEKNDGLHGSRRLAEQLVKDGRSAKVRAVIILDMVGDRDLNITIPHNSALSLVSALFAAAEKEGTREKFTLWMTQILDDHTPFLSAGMPAIYIIDFEYGSARGQNDYWHTPQDTVDKLSVQSLGIVGRTVLRLLDDLMRGP